MLQRGERLLVLLLLVLLLCAVGRRDLPSGEVPPAFSWRQQPGKIFVALGEGFVEPGLRHFDDGVDPECVIKLTKTTLPVSATSADIWRQPLQSGERLVLRTTDGGSLERTFLPAAQRMLLGIPLRPEQMTRSDWEALPGVGPKLAEAIEKDRQKNGEFGSVEDLKRVKGVGEKRVAEWCHYFAAASR